MIVPSLHHSISETGCTEYKGQQLGRTLVAQMGRDLSSVETHRFSLGWEDLPWRRRVASHSVLLT